jgi:Mrp family chromosome partitioning ATPase
MSRTLDTLRQTDPRPPETPLPAAASPQAEPPAAPATTAPEEEVPFIEVGPRRSFEASASVLATLPAAMPSRRPAPARDHGAIQKPHGVHFRAIAMPTRFARELVAYHAPGQPAAAAYSELLRKIRETVAGRGTERAAVLLFAATRPRTGATTALLNVAITAAVEGKPVAVVDANLRRAAVAERLGLEPAPGLTEVLAGECSLADALRPTEQPRLFALTAGAPTPMLATGEELRTLLDQLRAEHDLVLVDAPHWDSRAGVMALASACDAVLLVVPACEADSPPASELVRALPEKGIPLAGCVLTPG